MAVKQWLISAAAGVLALFLALSTGYLYYDRGQVQKALDKSENRVTELVLDNATLRANQITLESALNRANDSVDAFVLREQELSEKVRFAQEEAKKKAGENANLQKKLSEVRFRGDTECERAVNLAEDLVRMRQGS